MRLKGDGFIVEALGDLDCDKTRARYWITEKMDAPGAQNEIE